MAQGDINNPNAWNSGTPTLGTGTVGAPQPQGGIAGDAGNVPGDPDQFVGSYTLKSVAPTLGTGTVASPTGKGDVGDIEGFPDLANNSQVKGLAAFTTGTPTLVTQAHATSTGKGDVPDVGMSPTPKNEWNDSAGGTGTLTSWSSNSPTLGLGTVTLSKTQGDVDAIYSPNEHFAGVNPTWANNTPTLGLGTVTTDTDGEGDITDPFAWQDAIFYLTSQLYPLYFTDNLTGNGNIVYQPTYQWSENLTAAGGLVAGTLTLNLFSYSNWPAEHVAASGNVISGTLILGLVTYGNWPAEHVQASGGLVSGTLILGLITYSNWPAENLTGSGNLVGGTLS